MIQVLKQKAKSQEVAYGTFIFEFFDSGVPMMVKQSGGEFIIFDMEHSGLGLDRLKPLVLLCRALNIAPLVRLPDSQYHHIAGALDIGVQGIIVPMIETVEQMEAIIKSAKYHPIGQRGNAFGFSHDNFLGGSVPAKMAELNDKVMIIPLIESKLGMENAKAIAALPEVDLLWIGHLDLSSSIGIPGDFEHAAFKEAIKLISEGAASSDKSCGIVIPNETTMESWYKLGFRFFSYSTDVFLFQNALTQGIARMKEKAKEF